MDVVIQSPSGSIRLIGGCVPCLPYNSEGAMTVPSLPSELWSHIFDYAFDYPNLIDPDDGSELPCKNYLSFKESRVSVQEACYAPAYRQILPLLRVNTFCYNLLVPKLYRHVSLRDDEQAGLFLKAVERAPCLAKRVDTLDIKSGLDPFRDRTGVSQFQGDSGPLRSRPNLDLGRREAMLETLLHHCSNLKALLLAGKMFHDGCRPVIRDRINALQLCHDPTRHALVDQCPQNRPLQWNPLGTPHAVVIIRQAPVDDASGARPHAVYLNDSLRRVEADPSEQLDAFFATSQPGLLDVILLTSNYHVPPWPIWDTRSLTALQRNLRNLCIQGVKCSDRLVRQLSDVLLSSSAHQQRIIFHSCRFESSRVQVLAFFRVLKASVKLVQCDYDFGDCLFW